MIERVPLTSGAEWAPGVWHRNIEECIACTALAITVLCTSWGVFTRYVSAQPATWAAEIAAAGFCWVIFFGAAAVYKRAGHVSIDVLVVRLPNRLRHVIALSADLLVLVFLIGTSWLATIYTVNSWDSPMPSLRWPYSLHYAGAALGLMAMTLRHAHSTWRRQLSAY